MQIYETNKWKKSLTYSLHCDGICESIHSCVSNAGHEQQENVSKESWIVH